MYYPLTFEPIYKQMIWGSEQWDITYRTHEMSVINNGAWAGKTLEEYISQNREAILGTRLATNKHFPLLIKFINAEQALSVQVHPTDDYAKEKGENNGKSELWYIISPPTNGKLVIGLKPETTKEKLLHACKYGIVEEYLNMLPVKTGDIVDIPAGMVHALTTGAKVLEIQQNSDTTYRLYDYNRHTRPLHIDEALEVINFNNDFHKTWECHISKQVITHPVSTEEQSNPEAFSIITCVEGQVTIETDSHFPIEIASSVLIPARLGFYRIIPKSSKTVLIKIEP